MREGQARSLQTENAHPHGDSALRGWSGAATIVKGSEFFLPYGELEGMLVQFISAVWENRKACWSSSFPPFVDSSRQKDESICAESPDSQLRTGWRHRSESGRQRRRSFTAGRTSKAFSNRIFFPPGQHG